MIRRLIPYLLLAACHTETTSDTGVEDTRVDDTAAGDVADATQTDVPATDTAVVDAPEADAEPDLPPVRLCNGAAHLCDRPFDQVVLPGTHNSMSARDEDFFAPNQEHGIDRQLEDGIRGFLIDTYFWQGEYQLCHGTCEIGSTTAAVGLGYLRDFLVANPDEVIAIIFQNAISPEQTVEMMEAAQLDSLVMQPRTGPWPTLAELIDNNERILVTLESGSGPDWLPRAWDVYFDTRYSFSEESQFNCAVNRGSGDNPLHLLNHWLQDPLPLPELGARANAYETLRARVDQCAEQDVFPNLIAVDFYETGDLFEIVAELNAPDAK